MKCGKGAEAPAILRRGRGTPVYGCSEAGRHTRDNRVYLININTEFDTGKVPVSLKG